jgi:hypothetical protein
MEPLSRYGLSFDAVAGAEVDLAGATAIRRQDEAIVPEALHLLKPTSAKAMRGLSEAPVKQSQSATSTSS